MLTVFQRSGISCVSRAKAAVFPSLHPCGAKKLRPPHEPSESWQNRCWFRQSVSCVIEMRCEIRPCVWFICYIYSLICCCCVSQQWYDHYLRWNQSEYPGVKNLRFTPDQVWTPDILLYNRYAPPYRRLRRLLLKHRSAAPPQRSRQVWRHLQVQRAGELQRFLWISATR